MLFGSDDLLLDLLVFGGIVKEDGQAVISRIAAPFVPVPAYLAVLVELHEYLLLGGAGDLLMKLRIPPGRNRLPEDRPMSLSAVVSSAAAAASFTYVQR